MKFNRLVSLAIIGIAILFSTVGSSAQTVTKNILAEYFTNVSDASASSANPGNMTYFMTNLNATNPVIPIVYHIAYNNTQENKNYPDGIFSSLSSTARSGVSGRFSFSEPTTYQMFVAAGNKFGSSVNQTSMKEAIASAKGTGKSTYQITTTLTLDGDSVRVDAVVKSTAAITNKRLYVVLCEGYHWYNQIGTNGEKDFYFVAREFMAKDGFLNISAAANANYTKSFATYLNPEWYSNMLYAVVFVQDSATKEVYQAGMSTMPSLTGVTTRAKKGATIPQDVTYNLIDRNTPFTKAVNIKNDNDVEITCKVLMGASDMPSTWKAELSQNLVTIPAKGNIDLNVVITPDQTPGYADITIGVFPVGLENAFPLPAYHKEYFMTKDIKVACFTGGSICSDQYNVQNDLYHAYSIAGFSKSYSQETAIIPLNEVTLTKFPTTNYGFAAFFFDGLLIDADNGYSQFIYGGYAKQIIALIKGMLSNGKKVWLSSGFDHWIGLASQDADIVDFFQNYIGVDISNTPEGNPYYSLVYVGSDNRINFYTYQVKGIDGDIIGGGMNVNATQRTADWSGATFYTCPIIPRAGSEAVPFSYMNEDADQYLGIYKKFGKGKLVYTTVGCEAMSTTESRLDYLDRILGWLDPLGEVGARITSNTSSITFLDMEIGQTETVKVKVTNTGTEPLIISKYEILGTYADRFELIPPFTQNVTIAPEASQEIIVQFKAKNSGSMDATLRFTSNATNAPELNIPMLAEVKTSGSGPQIATDALNSEVDFGTITPQVQATKTLKISSNGNEPLIITMVDFPNDTRGCYGYAEGTHFPITIEPSKSYNLVITVKNNKANDTYNTDMLITSNAKNSPTTTIAVKSKTGVNSVSEGRTQDGLFTMTASPNPASERSIISMTLAGIAQRNVNVYVIDLSGMKVAEICNSTMLPGSTLNEEFNVAALASGKYFVVANVGGDLVQVPVVVTK